MEIYILRHGIAEDTQPDADRALTAEGRDKLKRVLGCAAVKPSLILASPYRRAVETAEIAAESLDYKGKVVRTRALLPESPPSDVWEEIRSHKDEPAILLASHEPLTAFLVAFLLGTPGLQVDMKKAALVRVDCDRIAAQPKCVLKWMITPAVARE
jgi:phosphohistidine phosphatase SixA